MNKEMDAFPYDIRGDLGEILEAQREAPGVYYLLTKNCNQLSNGQYYIIEESSPVISMSAKKYGKPLPSYCGLLAFNIEDIASGQKIIEFEIARYNLKNKSPGSTKEALADVACAGMETNPEYFGYYPVPVQTPWGKLIRYKTLSNGIYWIETDRLETVLAICDIYEDSLYDRTREAATRLDEAEGRILWSFSYLFYPYKISCIPLFELLPTHREWIEMNMINKAALMNAIWESDPGYAATYNVNEQMGLHDGVGDLLRSFGAESPLNSSVNHTIVITPEVGDHFCTLFE